MALSDDSTQKAADRPVSFLLQSGNKVIAGPFNLIIRPEELTRSEPSRVNVQQTLGGAWADSFGRGLSQINLTGHTGWRGSSQRSVSAKDGRSLFFDLRDAIYVNWHAQRAEALKNNASPDKVELFFTDTLDDISVVVAPLAFNLRRSRSRPLLMMYQIQLIALRDANTAPTIPSTALLTVDQPKLDRQALSSQSISALQSSIDDLKSISTDIRVAYNAIAQPIVDLCDQSASLLQAAHDQVSQVQDTITMPVLQIAGDVQLASHNITQTTMDALGGTQSARLTLQRAASTFREAFCNLSNLTANLAAYLNFDGLLGASNCSSTTGGSPQSIYRDTNVFAIIAAPPPPPITPLTADASDAVREAAADMLSLGAHTQDYKFGLAQRISRGILV